MRLPARLPHGNRIIVICDHLGSRKETHIEQCPYYHQAAHQKYAVLFCTRQYNLNHHTYHIQTTQEQYSSKQQIPHQAELFPHILYIPFHLSIPSYRQHSIVYTRTSILRINSQQMTDTVTNNTTPIRSNIDKPPLRNTLPNTDILPIKVVKPATTPLSTAARNVNI